ncbi:MAG: PQQ-binding-like beta-propeller repeat protein [Pirellulaceae bacterium]
MNAVRLSKMVVLLVGAILTTNIVMAADWPRFRGPDCTGISPETGLVQEIPEAGLPLLWQIEGCGTGYSSVSIVDGKIFTMGDRPDGDNKSQFVIAFDLAARKELWATKIGPKHDDGSRCTPTIDGDRLYALGTDSDLVCLDVNTGELKWKKNLEQDFGGEMMSGWRWSESPLVDGDQVVCTPGVQDAAMVALNKSTGELIWKCAMPEIGDRGKDGSGYSTMVVAEIDGVRQYMTIIGRGAIGVAAETGKFLWGYNRIANGVANIPSPVVRDRHVFVTTSYKTGSALLKLTKQGDVFDVEEVYFLTPKEFENHHGGVVLLGDHIYGGDGQNNGTPVCLDFLTGKIKWKALDWKRKANADRSAAVLAADGHLWFRYERDALVALIEATPDEFRVKGTFKAAVDDGPAWAHPVIHDGKLYLRTNDVLMCYDVKPRE